MRTDAFGNNLTNNVNFLVETDRNSARSFNRPTRAIFENSVDNYNLIQSMAKMLYGDKQSGYIQGILEEFNYKNITFKKRNDKYYLRLPTGAFYYNPRVDKNVSDEEEDFDSSKYLQRDYNSAFFIVSPNTELFERQFAEHYCFDLDEQYNDAKLTYTVEKDENNGYFLNYNLKISKFFYDYKKTVSTESLSKSVEEIVEMLKSNEYSNSSFYLIIDDKRLEITEGEVTNNVYSFKAGEIEYNNYVNTGTYNIEIDTTTTETIKTINKVETEISEKNNIINGEPIKDTLTLLKLFDKNPICNFIKNDGEYGLEDIIVFNKEEFEKIKNNSYTIYFRLNSDVDETETDETEDRNVIFSTNKNFYIVIGDEANNNEGIPFFSVAFNGTDITVSRIIEPINRNILEVRNGKITNNLEVSDSFKVNKNKFTEINKGLLVKDENGENEASYNWIMCKRGVLKNLF